MKKNKVSIVVPIYNVANFVDKCLISLINQTYKNLEIILINDGSKDNSLEIIKNYEMKYPDIIKVYNQENHGVGYTRNRGLQLATGKYITFVDSDDYLDNDFIEILVKNIGNNDVVLSGHKRVLENGRIIEINNLKENEEWSKLKYLATWAKLYKLDFLKRHKIIYPSYKIGEDICLNIKVLSITEKIKVISYTGYNYLVNSNSVTNSVKKKYEMLPILKDLHENVKNGKIALEDLYQFYRKTMIFNLYLQRKAIKSEELNAEYEEFFKWLKSIGYKIKWFNKKSESLKINIIMNLFAVSEYLHLTKILFMILKLV